MDNGQMVLKMDKVYIMIILQKLFIQVSLKMVKKMDMEC